MSDKQAPAPTVPTPEEITALKAVVEAATPGPWHDDGYRVYGPTVHDDPRSGTLLWEYKHLPYDDFHGAHDNGIFAVAARTELPRLLALVEAWAPIVERKAGSTIDHCNGTWTCAECEMEGDSEATIDHNESCHVPLAARFFPQEATS